MTTGLCPSSRIKSLRFFSLLFYFFCSLFFFSFSCGLLGFFLCHADFADFADFSFSCGLPGLLGNDLLPGGADTCCFRLLDDCSKYLGWFLFAVFSCLVFCLVYLHTDLPVLTYVFCPSKLFCGIRLQR